MAPRLHLFDVWGTEHVRMTRGISDARYVARRRRYLDPENLASEPAFDHLRSHGR